MDNIDDNIDQIQNVNYTIHLIENFEVMQIKSWRVRFLNSN